jgi:hypothetical protein
LFVEKGGGKIVLNEMVRDGGWSVCVVCARVCIPLLLVFYPSFGFTLLPYFVVLERTMDVCTWRFCDVMPCPCG